MMKDYQNPIIQDNPIDTLYYAQSVLSVLQEFYSAVDLPQRDQDKNICCGLYWILKCTGNAIGYEIERFGKKGS
jgi:hypothetical protein